MHHHNCAVLLHKRLGKIKDEDTFGGFRFCKECDERIKDGFIAVVEASTGNSKNEIFKMHEVEYTGAYAFIKEKAFTKLFKHPVPDKPMVWVPPGTIDWLSRVEGAQAL